MNALTTTTPSTDEIIRVLQSSLYPGAKRESVELVLSYCRVNGIDPMLKPVHIVPTSVKTGPDKWETRDVLMPGISDYRIKAARSGQYGGKSEPEFGPEHTETIGGVSVTYPIWCKVTVSRIVQGQARTFTAVERWRENCAEIRKTGAPNEMWRKRAYGQLAKCAEAQALRMAFPEFSGGQPTAEEMEGKELFAGATIDAEPAKKATPTPREQINAEIPLAEEPPPPRKMTWAQLLDSFALAIQDASTTEEIDHILRSPQMTEAKAHIGRARIEHQKRFDEIMVMADERRQALGDDTAEAEVSEDELPEIIGTEKVLAG